MNFSVVALRAKDSSTSSRILDAVESSYSFVVLMSILADRLMDPETTSVPSEASFGMDSPVRALVSRVVDPEMTTPSRGTFSPGRTVIVSPTETSSGSTVSVTPSLTTWAMSGCRSTRELMDSLVFPTARFSNHSPIWKNSITATASGNMTSAAPGMNETMNAPAVAMTIRRFSSKNCPWPMLRAALSTTS